MLIATLIAADRLARGDISAAADALLAAGLEPRSPAWVEEGSACDLAFAGDLAAARSALEGRFAGVDVVVQPSTSRRKQLLAADMDSTIVAVECLDELADFAGKGREVAALTERAMRGEVDFEAALDARMALLAGFDDSLVDRCREERVHASPGARTLVATMRAHGAFCLLVTGGFTRFAEPVADILGFNHLAANRFEVAAGRLTGRVARPIVGAAGKLDAMLAAAAANDIPEEAILAVGDGANDIPMIEAAGLGIAYRAKPKLAAAADARIDHNDLTALLYAQGYARSEWVGD